MRTTIFLILSLVGTFILGYFSTNPMFGEPLKTPKTTASNLQMDYNKVSKDRLVYSKTNNPSVTITMFTDFECHFCHMAAQEVHKLLEKNPDIRLIFKDYPLDQSCNYKITRPFHQYACNASISARCAADQGKFWEYHDLVYNYNGALDNDVLTDFAKQIELDITKYNTCVSSKEPLDKILTNIDEATSLGVSGTPTFFIEGQKVEGFAPYEKLQEIVDKIKADKEKQKKEFEEMKKQQQNNIKNSVKH